MAKHKIIEIEGAAAMDLPLSNGLVYKNLIFISGQVSKDLKTGERLVGDAKAETKQVLKNMQTLLEHAGSSLDCVVKTTVFLTDKSNFDAMNSVYVEAFKGIKPARSTLFVQLVGDFKVEIEAVAYIPD